MKIYIVVFTQGGLVEEVKPFLDEKKAEQYGKKIEKRKSFNDDEDVVSVGGEDLPLPASIETRIKQHLARGHVK